MWTKADQSNSYKEKALDDMKGTVKVGYWTFCRCQNASPYTLEISEEIFLPHV